VIGNLMRRIFRAFSGNSGPTAQLPVISDEQITRAVHAVLGQFLRQPLAYPSSVDYELVSRLQAAAESADYMVKHMMGAQNLRGRAELLDFALGACTVDGLVLEFGVFRGESLRFIAKRVQQEIVGFDSFEGLPEDWTSFQKQGRFTLNGVVPEFSEPNIRICKGWFEDTLPGFLAEQTGPARFIHIDCDIYSSTKTVLNLLSSRIVKGTVIVFDEYLNYPSWREHEYRAFQEFTVSHNLKYRYIGFASSHYSVAVVIE